MILASELKPPALHLFSPTRPSQLRLRHSLTPLAAASNSPSSHQFKNAAAAVGLASMVLGAAALVLTRRAVDDNKTKTRERADPSLEIVRAPRSGLHWLLGISKPRSADAEVALIEAKRTLEAKHEMLLWDQRWSLREKTLAELKLMAARFKVSGRARMRKNELVAALEQRLGLLMDGDNSSSWISSAGNQRNGRRL